MQYSVYLVVYLKVDSVDIIIFSLAPKCYYAFDRDSEEIKRSSKGVSKRFELNYGDYKDVLYTNKVVSASNVSIRKFRGEMSTIIQSKRGLQNKLIKSFVEADKVTVSPFQKFQ